MAVSQSVEDFFKFVNNRHQIFLHRFDPTFTDTFIADPYITQFHYTNVYRELDRGTVFYIYDIAHSVHFDNGMDRFFATLVYRLFNKIETFLALYDNQVYPDISGGWDNDIALDVIRDLDTPFTNAFMVTGSAFPEIFDKAGKAVASLDEIHTGLQGTWDKVKYSKTLEEVWSIIRDFPMFGPFLAYEVVCDMMYAKLIPFTENDWVNVGPGCAKGIAEIFPKLKRGEYEKTISFLANEQDTYLIPMGFHYLNGKRLTLRNVEHSLCEFSKYMRALRGERMKRKWHGPTKDNGWYKRALFELYGIGVKPS